MPSWTVAGTACGTVAAILSILEAIPQIYLNMRRRSTTGFSHVSVYIRFFGLSFLLASAILTEMAISITIFALCNLISLMIFLHQFALYGEKGGKWIYALWLFPFAVFALGLFYPRSMVVTQWINSATQALGFFPYMYALFGPNGTMGIAMMYHHVNFVASLFGLLACSLLNVERVVEWLVHAAPLFFSVSVFMVALLKDQMRYLDAPRPNEHV